MSTLGYIGVNGLSKKISSIYIGINNLSKKVNKAYIGVNGVSRLWYTSIPDPFYIYNQSGQKVFNFPSGKSIQFQLLDATFKNNRIDISVGEGSTSSSYTHGFCYASSTINPSKDFGDYTKLCFETYDDTSYYGVTSGKCGFESTNTALRLDFEYPLFSFSKTGITSRNISSYKYNKNLYFRFGGGERIKVSGVHKISHTVVSKIWLE